MASLKTGLTRCVLAAAVLLASCAAPSGQAQPSRPAAAGDGHHVILLHGLARTPWSMGKMAEALGKAGYTVHNLGYPSREKPIPALVAEHVRPAVADLPETATRLHFVTHSMGGILVRYYRDRHTPPLSGRTVMLAPPNRGSDLARLLAGFGPYRWVMGPAGQQLADRADSLVRDLPPADFPVGVIAGTGGILPVTAPVFDGPNDGIVAVEATKLPGMADHMTVSASHAWIMRDDAAIAATLRFLRFGAFES